MTARKGIKTNIENLNNGGTDKTLKLIIELNKGRNSKAQLPKYESYGTMSNGDTKGYLIIFMMIKYALMTRALLMRRRSR